MALNKYDDLVIDPKEPWSGDTFKRRTHGERLSTLIRTLEKPYVISLRADWGTGKSVFLRRLAAQLELDGVGAVIVDAWKTDYFEDPLLAFASELTARLDVYVKGDVAGNAKRKARTVAKNLAKHASQLAAPLAKAVASVKAPGSAEAAEAVAALAIDAGTRLISWGREKKSAEDEFREQLRQLRDVLSDHVPGRRITNPFVVIIDELDRCRPDYAVRSLERIKHFFNVQSVVFLIATDKSNLPSAIAHVYGGESDQAERYLRKFIDFEYTLPKPAASDFADALVQHFDLKPLMGDVKVADWAGKYDEAGQHDGYLHYYAELRREIDVLEAVTFFPKVAQAHELSLRDQAQAFTVMAAVLRTLPANAVCFPQVLAYLCSLRFFSHSIFERYVSGQLSFGSVVSGVQGVVAIKNPFSSSTNEGADLLAYATLESSGEPNKLLRQHFLSNDDLRQRGAYRRIWARTNADAAPSISKFGRSAVMLTQAFSEE